jgi:hypothetical protein
LRDSGVRPGRGAVALLLSAGLLTACTGWPGRNTAPTSIGAATLGADGVLTLQLIAREGGVVGHGRFTYPPDHPEYQKMLQHIGPIAPGETKSVPPWRSKRSGS